MFYRSFPFLSLSSLLIGVVLLTGCGGGGGGACTPIAGFRTCTDQSSTDASAQYDLSTLLAKVHQSSRTDTFSVIGSCTGTAEINRGTLLDITRNNTAQYAQSESATLTFTANSSCANALKGYSNESVHYYTNGKKAIDVVTNSTSLTLPLYREITPQSDLPTSASIGNNGAYRTWQSYADSTKTTAKGRIVETYELAQDGAATPSVSALLYIKSIETDASGQTLSTEKKSYRITPNGNITAINWEIVYPSLVNPPSTSTAKYDVNAFYKNWIREKQSVTYSVKGTCEGEASYAKGSALKLSDTENVISGGFNIDTSILSSKCDLSETFNIYLDNTLKDLISVNNANSSISRTYRHSAGASVNTTYSSTYSQVSYTNELPNSAVIGDGYDFKTINFTGTSKLNKSTPEDSSNKAYDRIVHSYRVERDGTKSPDVSVIVLINTIEYLGSAPTRTIQNRFRLTPDGSYTNIEQQIVNLGENPYFLILTAQ